MGCASSRQNDTKEDTGDAKPNAEAVATYTQVPKASTSPETDAAQPPEEATSLRVSKAEVQSAESQWLKQTDASRVDLAAIGVSVPGTEEVAGLAQEVVASVLKEVVAEVQATEDIDAIAQTVAASAIEEAHALVAAELAEKAAAVALAEAVAAAVIAEALESEIAETTALGQMIVIEAIEMAIEKVEREEMEEKMEATRAIEEMEAIGAEVARLVIESELQKEDEVMDALGTKVVHDAVARAVEGAEKDWKPEMSAPWMPVMAAGKAMAHAKKGKEENKEETGGCTLS
uniref:Uncharacterized protein n=1 Tax=Haptolina brevifila TaxID=156173 RepID=A0A7S2FMR0_9EUKA|mmetsp:Transcript_15331/g.30775  ORF Transcript_15331/g.30775 Transcript_15331/m.30775 type:complete len:289 (+) Transcript_15331:49-915(+)|eukprot:CAMPEP_0174719290 /NCGR_PEP_ID=MMETSP1094-20130205/30893_1 /TAXON_ID=156173 /ORGANISM="Chrysochromulina brevifilum, Strain UTEX LB 985" /LENGTH=288 /DNA_ID=CAMNT_0015919565 /DNA_START=47 /DNA_END=913 /DNA_ORIENTATION=+